jgi:hypothetical protein
MPRSVFIETFGCQMNEVDSSRMLSLLGDLSYRPADSREEADLILINTCSIREKAAHKVYSTLGALRGWKYGAKGRILAVGGCLAQQAGEEIRRRAPHVDIVFGTHNIAMLPEMVRGVETRRKRSVSVDMTGDTRHWDVLPYLPDGAVGTFVTIMQGCDNYCSYCIVPYVRGPEVSRPAGEIVAEIRALSEKGVREVVLLGQNVNSYGKKEGRSRSPRSFAASRRSTGSTGSGSSPPIRAISIRRRSACSASSASCARTSISRSSPARTGSSIRWEGDIRWPTTWRRSRRCVHSVRISPSRPISSSDFRGRRKTISGVLST